MLRHSPPRSGWTSTIGSAPSRYATTEWVARRHGRTIAASTACATASAHSAEQWTSSARPQAVRSFGPASHSPASLPVQSPLSQPELTEVRSQEPHTGQRCLGPRGNARWLAAVLSQIGASGRCQRRRSQSATHGKNQAEATGRAASSPGRAGAHSRGGAPAGDLNANKCAWTWEGEHSAFSDYGGRQSAESWAIQSAPLATYL